MYKNFKIVIAAAGILLPGYVYPMEQNKNASRESDRKLDWICELKTTKIKIKQDEKKQEYGWIIEKPNIDLPVDEKKHDMQKVLEFIQEELLKHENQIVSQDSWIWHTIKHSKKQQNNDIIEKVQSDNLVTIDDIDGPWVSSMSNVHISGQIITDGNLSLEQCTANAHVNSD